LEGGRIMSEEKWYRDGVGGPESGIVAAEGIYME